MREPQPAGSKRASGGCCAPDNCGEARACARRGAAHVRTPGVRDGVLAHGGVRSRADGARCQDGCRTSDRRYHGCRCRDGRAGVAGAGAWDGPFRRGQGRRGPLRRGPVWHWACRSWPYPHGRDPDRHRRDPGRFGDTQHAAGRLPVRGGRRPPGAAVGGGHRRDYRGNGLVPRRTAVRHCGHREGGHPRGAALPGPARRKAGHQDRRGPGRRDDPRQQRHRRCRAVAGDRRPGHGGRQRGAPAAAHHLGARRVMGHDQVDRC
jgi:hypothetical protein